MPLFDKLVAGLESADLTADELRQLQKLAPNLGQVVDTVLTHRQRKLKPCSTAEKGAISAFIEHIGYEITPAQPDEDTLEYLLSVPKTIEKILLGLMPFAHMPLLECLNSHAIANSNLNDMCRWLHALNDVFTRLAQAKPSRHQERFFGQVFEFTNKVGLDFASEAMDMMRNNSLTLDDVKSFFEELIPVQQSLLRRRRSYETLYYHSDDILAVLATKQSSFLPLLEATREVSQPSQVESEQPSPLYVFKQRRQTASQ